MIVAVGSTNPTKTRPVKKIFSKHFEDVKVVGVDVSSGVREQPLNDEEAYRGALTRARKSLRKVRDASFGVGIEGGLHKTGYGWFERSIVVIVNKKGRVGVGSSGGLILPDKVMKEIHKGKAIEQVVDEMFGTKKIGRGIGMFGLFTKGVVTRARGVEHGVAFALTRFLHEDLY